jgi:thioredoxin reductase (NADPH)
MNEEEQDLDVIIIGAGPAGLSAAIWCKDLGLKAIVLEKENETGGQLLSIYNPITNYPGLRAESGRELRDRFLETANYYGVEILLSTEITAIDPEKTSVTTAAGHQFSARSIILATGVRRRRLNIPGETEFLGKGIIESGSRDKELTRGKTVAIIGGGDAALENALILADYAAKVYVIHRRERISAREEFVKHAVASPITEFILDTEVVKINGNDYVESLNLTDHKTGLDWVVPVDNVLIRIGVEPNSELLLGNADLGSASYASTDRFSGAGEPNLYAIGDVANQIAPTIASAAGAGATAAKAVADWLAHKKPV